VAGFFLVNEADIAKVINVIKPDFEPVSLCAEKGRLADMALIRARKETIKKS
jgi:hypothetical protein